MMKSKKKIGISAACLLILVAVPFLARRMAVTFGIPSYLASYYSTQELAMLKSAGSIRDRREAEAVMELAEAAFRDCTHTVEENHETYGLLARYATASSYNAASESHSLKLLSAHLDAEKGYLWVYYSSEAFDEKGNTVCGSWKIPSLWTVEKDAAGIWTVVKIKEHP